ncbi:MAG TPA: class E sortase [Acidimicrobiales bacterium]|nr:class E sortase [Acidimicrobiales bacterium]
MLRTRGGRGLRWPGDDDPVPTTELPVVTPPPSPAPDPTGDVTPPARRERRMHRERRVRFAAGSRPQRAARRRVASVVWESAGFVITGLGVLLLLFLLYFYAFTPLSGVRNQHRLLLSLASDRKAVFQLALGHAPPEGSAIAVLTIPALHEKEAVVRGASAADLQSGPGLVPGSVVPGQSGNAVIAGRRVTYGAPFAGIGDLRAGDRIQVADGAGSFTFRVVRMAPLAPGQVLRTPGKAPGWLTLVTSNPSPFSSAHYVVMASLSGRPAAGTHGSASGRGSTTTAPAALPLSLGGDAGAVILAALWVVAFFGALWCGFLSLRRWGQPLVAYLLVVPVLLAFGLLVCENLARVFPATL